MASRPSWLGSLASPHHLATLLLGITTCLLTMTTIPASSSLYLIRTDAGRHGNAVSSTVWFGSTGYCTADASSSDIHSHIQCSGAVFGYDMASVLGRDETRTSPSSQEESSIISLVLTRGPAVLHPIATGLSLLSMAAHQSILRRPQAKTYAAAMGSGLLALLVTCVAFIFEHSLLAYAAAVSRLATTNATTATTTFSTTDGPLAGVMVWILAFQLAACVVGFYTCIGGKYQCEGGIRLEDDVEGAEPRRASLAAADEKCPL